MLEARSQTNMAQVANQAPSVTLKAQGPAYGPALGANIRFEDIVHDVAGAYPRIMKEGNLDAGPWSCGAPTDASW